MGWWRGRGEEGRGDPWKSMNWIIKLVVIAEDIGVGFFFFFFFFFKNELNWIS